MNVARILAIAAVIGGVISGPDALESVEAAKPPIQWGDLPFVLIGSTIGIVFVVGIQVLLKKSKPARIFSWFFGITGIYLAIAGLVAFGVAARHWPIQPSALFMLSMGVGTIVGALIAGRIHRAAFAT